MLFEFLYCFGFSTSGFEFMLIGGLQKVTLIDYPGRVATTVFTAGCNFCCPFCHNPDLVEIGRNRNQFFLTDDEVLNFLQDRQGMIEGVCLSGGEPTIQSDLPEFIKKIKELGFLVKLDTNGSRPEVLEDLLKDNLVDYVAMDIKGPLEKYKKFISGNPDFEKIHQSTILARRAPDYEFRTTVVPGLHEKGDFLSISRWLEGAKKYFLQQFRPGNTLDSSFSQLKPYPDEKIAEFCNAIKPYFEICEVRV